jgi:hypothetical protein
VARVKTQDDSFPRDFLASLRVWRLHPVLPFLSTLIWAAPAFFPDDPVFFVVVLPILLFSAGWAGTERIWYLRAFRRSSIRPGELWGLTWAFVWRFVKLGLLIFVTLLPVLAIAYWNPSLLTLLIAILAVPIDMSLTFVTPALSYTTKSVRTALRLGLRMVRTEWPASAWYVLFPPLATLAAARILPASRVGIPGRFGLAVASTLLYVAFKGATAAFYLRRHDVGQNGAAFSENGDEG